MAVEARRGLADEHLCAYLAGLVDGDGSLLVRRRDSAGRARDRARGISFILLVIVGGEPTHLTALRADVGGLGSIYTRKREGQRHLALWTIAGKQARATLQAIYPYMRLKAAQAWVMLCMPQPRSRWAATPALRDAQERARVRVSELNRRFGRGKVVEYGGPQYTPNGDTHG